MSDGAPQVVLFTRDLRVDDHPALVAAAAAGPVVPLFVLDGRILGGPFAAPNRLALLAESLVDLHAALADAGAGLAVRHGDVAAQVAAVVAHCGAGAVHLSLDVSPYAHARLARLRAALPDHVTGHAHPGTTVHPPGRPSPASGDAYRVFTPYWRAWRGLPTREPVGVPDLALPGDLDATGPDAGQLALLDRSGTAPRRIHGGLRAAARRLDAWLDGPVDEYVEGHDDLASDRTSRLSADLHLGTLSPLRVALAAGQDTPGREAFVRQLCWRDHWHQLLADQPSLATEDLRPQGDVWHDAPEELAAWQQGRTGVPVVDAGMRQLLAEGWMHNRARLVTASFLTKHLRIDWRVGAAWFEQHLVDGDVANNRANWQWVTGTGTGGHPNRMLNPYRQSRRFGAAAYVRRFVPELAGLDDDTIHEPGTGGLLSDLDYPPPLVDHATARGRFLAERGQDVGR